MTEPREPMLKAEKPSVLSLVPRRAPDEVLSAQAPPSPSDRYTVLLLDEAQLDRLLERQGVRPAPQPQLGAPHSRLDQVTAGPPLARHRWGFAVGGAVASVVVVAAMSWLWSRPSAAVPAAAAATAAASAPDVTPVVATGASFSVDVSTFADDGPADQAATRLTSAGWPAFTWRLEEGRRHVLVGPYASVEEAEASQRLLGPAGFPATRLHVDDRLRVTMLASPTTPQAPRYPDVKLVAAPGRLSYVVELADEPRSVSGQRVSAASFVVLASPLATPVEQQVWKAPGDVRLVSRIAVSPHAQDPRMLQAVVTLAETADASVRLEGRRVYVDVFRRVDVVTPVDIEPTTRRPDTLPNVPRAVADAATPGARDAAGGTVGAGRRLGEGRLEERRDGGVSDDLTAYRAAIQPLIARFEEVQPFLRSAVAAATPDVLAALSGTCAELEQALSTVSPPSAARAVHGLLLSAAQLARAAAAPSYAGDRAGQVREAAVQFAAAKARLVDLGLR